MGSLKIIFTHFVGTVTFGGRFCEETLRDQRARWKCRRCTWGFCLEPWRQDGRAKELIPQRSGTAFAFWPLLLQILVEMTRNLRKSTRLALIDCWIPLDDLSHDEADAVSWLVTLASIEDVAGRHVIAQVGSEDDAGEWTGCLADFDSFNFV